MSFPEESQKCPEALHAPQAHVGTGALFNTQFWNCCSLQPLPFVFGSWRVQELSILLWLLVDWWPSVPESPPFCRMLHAAPRAGGGCSRPCTCPYLSALLFSHLHSVSSSCLGDSTDTVTDGSSGKGANRNQIVESSL